MPPDVRLNAPARLEAPRTVAVVLLMVALPRVVIVKLPVNVLALVRVTFEELALMVVVPVTVSAPDWVSVLALMVRLPPTVVPASVVVAVVLTSEALPEPFGPSR